MKPILYAANATNFFNLGLGVLNEAYSCLVYEKRNGAFYLEMEYPVDGALFKELQNNRLIKADAGHELTDQRFKIKKITKPIDGKVKIYAEHVSYKAAELALKPHVNIRNVTAQQALQQWQNNFIDDDKPFTLSSNITTVNSTSWSIREVENPRQALGGVQGSILDVWGGEYKFDNYHISLFRERGVRANALIAYGRNITDFEQEEDITSVYTSVYPYAVYTDEDGVEQLVTIPEYIVDSEHVDKYPNRMVLPIDFTAEFGSEETPTVQRLRSMAQSYIESNEIGIPKVSIRLTHVDLSKTLDYKQYKGLEKVNLCDNVLVKFLKLGVDTTAKVIGIIWNVLLERYEELEIGESRSSLSSRLNAIDQEARQARKEASDARNFSSVAANGINMVFFGPDEPTATKVGDRWFEENGEYTISRVWDGVIWRVIHDPRITDENKRAIEAHQKDIQEAKEAADQALIVGQDALKAGQDAQQAADDALEAGNEAKALGEQAQTAADDALAAGNQAQSLAEQAKADASEATMRANAANQQINDAIQNAGFTSLNALTSNLRNITEDAQLRADEAVSDAVNALSNAHSALSALSDVESSVSDIRIDIDEIEGTLALKASQTDLDSITGIVDQHTLDIQANAQGLTVKADRSTVDTLSGTVNSLSTEVGLVAGELSSKISQTQLNSAIDGIKVGGRNWVVRANELDRAMIDTSGNVTSGSNTAVMRGYIRVEPGETLTFTKSHSELSTDAGFWRWRWFDENETYISRTANSSNKFQWVVPSATYYIQVSYPVDSYPKVEKSNKATDWTPAPEDTDARISSVESSFTQRADGFDQSISSIQTDLNGKATTGQFNTLSSRVDGTVQTIGNLEGDLTTIQTTVNGHTTAISNAQGDITAIQSNINGIQSTVANKANQSDFTQLAMGFSLLSRQTIQNLSATDSEGKSVPSAWNLGSQLRVSSHEGEGFVVAQATTNASNHAAGRLLLAGNVLESGKIYTITLKLNGSSEGRRIEIGQTGNSSVIKRVIGLNTEVISFAYESQNTNSLSIWLNDTGFYRIREFIIYEGGGASTSQLSVLNDAINLRVSKGDVMSQINIEAGRTLIQSDRLLLDANTVIFTGSAFIPGASIVNATINSAQIANAAISTAKIGDAQINNAKIANLAVSEAKIANLAVGTAKIANAAITNAKIANLAVDTAQIANAAISSAKIGTAAIQTAHIGDGVITNAKIGNAEITGAKIQDASIASAKIINLDANRIVGNTTEFVQSAWNGVNNSVSIDSGGIHIQGVNEEIRLYNGNVDFLNYRGNPTAYLSSSYVNGQEEGIGVFLRPGNIFSITEERSGGNKTLFRVRQNAHFYTNLNMDNNTIYNVHRYRIGSSGYLLLGDQNSLPFDSTSLISSGVVSIGHGAPSNWVDRIRVGSRVDMLGVTNFNSYRIEDVHSVRLSRGALVESSSLSLGLITQNTLLFGIGTATSWTNRMEIGGNVVMYTNLNMRGSNISNVGTLSYDSDERLKENINQSNQKSLDIISDIKFVTYDWIDKDRHPGTQFGVIAQQVHPILQSYDEKADEYGINANAFQMVTSHAVQQLNDKFATFKTDTEFELWNHKTLVDEKIEKMEDKLNILEEKVKLLEAA